MAKTILYFTDSQVYGGAEQALLRLMEGLDRRRWTPWLAYHPAPRLEAFLDAACQCGARLFPVHEMPLGWDGARRMGGFLSLIRREHPDVFHAHLSWPLGCKWALTAAVLGRTPAVVATEHLYIDMEYTRSARFQQRLLASSVGRYIAVSPSIARQLSGLFHIPTRKISVIPNAAPPEFFHNVPMRPRPGELSAVRDRPIVLTVARLDVQKGQRYLLDAAAGVPEAVFVLVGEGPERISLEAQARDLGIADRVIFAGYQANVPDWLANSDLFVLSSLYEGLPISLIEASAAGLPVIATDIPGNNEVIHHGYTGWLVPPQDPQALAGAIRTLLENPDLRLKLGIAGQERARQEYSLETHIRRVIQIYEELLD